MEGFPVVVSESEHLYGLRPAGHLLGKPRVIQVSFAEFQPHAPIWIMYAFRSHGWALNKL
jgi:hypothetical protein